MKSEELSTATLAVETLLDCIKNDDLDSFREVLAAHLTTVNKMDLAKKTGIGRRTLYDLIDTERHFYPGLATISALLNTLAT